MATVESYTPQPVSATNTVAHPLCPLTASEISTSAEIIRTLWPAKTDIRFKVITLEEPTKKNLVPYLEAEHSGKSLPQIQRKAFIAYYIRNTVSLIMLLTSE